MSATLVWSVLLDLCRDPGERRESSSRNRSHPVIGGGDEQCPPRRAELFNPTRIVFCKGSLADPWRRDLVGATALYPEAKVLKELDCPHNRVDLGSTDARALHYLGKKTLVFGEHRSAVRLSQEEGNACPNYWHFSPYGFCPYGNLAYCYLAGTRGNKVLRRRLRFS